MFYFYFYVVSKIRMMIKNILGLDLGTNSIGWALINKILKISMAKFWEWEAELSQCHRIF
jgi:hypothetical protein